MEINGDKRLHVLQPILFVILIRNMQIYSLRVYIASLGLWIFHFQDIEYQWHVHCISDGPGGFGLFICLFCCCCCCCCCFALFFYFPVFEIVYAFINQHYTKVNHLLTYTFSLILTYIFTYLSTSFLTYFPTCLLTSLTYV